MTVSKPTRPPIWRPEPDASEIGNRIRTMMECKGMTVAALSRKTGIAYGTLDAYVNGRRVPVLRNLIALAMAFRVVSLDALLFGGTRSQWHRRRRANNGQGENERHEPG